MNPLNIIYGVISAAVLGAIGFYIWECESAKTFKDKAVVMAEAARDAAIKQMVRDRQAKEKADAALKIARADNQSLDKRLRDERARARSVSRFPARAPSPERACFRGPIIDAAVARLIEDISRSSGQLDTELSAIVGQCQDAVSWLDTAKAWAQSQ